ncbi:MAG: hypothetical protein K0S91_2566 [Nitrososphaeraceae archaeon]|jgi:hypothetical protein|nr:hypothetical protein [Nitrososphaeraceae archaeon]
MAKVRISHTSSKHGTYIMEEWSSQTKLNIYLEMKDVVIE